MVGGPAPIDTPDGCPDGWPCDGGEGCLSLGPDVGLADGSLAGQKLGVPCAGRAKRITSNTICVRGAMVGAMVAAAICGDRQQKVTNCGNQCGIV